METKLLTGIVQSGGASPAPLPNVPVTVYEATAQSASIVGAASTNSEGRFELIMDRDKTDFIFYAVATVSQAVELVTFIGPVLQYDKPAWITASPPGKASDSARDAAATPLSPATEAGEHGPGDTASITINELTTVAAAFSMAQFIQNGTIGGDAFGLQIASLMFDNLVERTSGASPEVLLRPPNGDQTNTLRSTRSLANLIAACIGDDNIWVANFGKMLPCADYTHAAISCLAGANASTRPQGFEIGEAISPPTGYTLPTAGAEVTLPNGQPLYGGDQGSSECHSPSPCYSPLMRMTSVIIDQAGNVWAVNNWKPNFDIDASPECGNPGGDGVVIFVGLAKPPGKTQ